MKKLFLIALITISTFFLTEAYLNRTTTPKKPLSVQVMSGQLQIQKPNGSHRFEETSYNLANQDVLITDSQTRLKINHIQKTWILENSKIKVSVTKSNKLKLEVLRGKVNQQKSNSKMENISVSYLKPQKNLVDRSSKHQTQPLRVSTTATKLNKNLYQKILRFKPLFRNCLIQELRRNVNNSRTLSHKILLSWNQYGRFEDARLHSLNKVDSHKASQKYHICVKQVLSRVSYKDFKKEASRSIEFPLTVHL